MNNSRWIVSTIVLALFVGFPVGGYILLYDKSTSANTIGAVLRDNGYVEFRPPSKLVPPGTWVSVSNTDPLHLSIICSPKSALGLDQEFLQSSVSADATIVSKLGGVFGVHANVLTTLEANEKFKALKKISFNLSNVRILEISDSVVLEGISKRSDSCRDAIRLRIETNVPVTMIKSALIADVSYSVELGSELDANAKASLEKSLALRLDIKLEGKETGSVILLGRDLIWGVREDALLAKAGFGLPPTGGTNAPTEVLEGYGPVVKVLSNRQARREFSADVVLAKYDVAPLKQGATMDCWATVYTMLKSWREGKDWTVPDAVSELGGKYPEYYLGNTGLPGGQELDFVRLADMKAKPPANYSLSGFVSMLTEHGPLWIIVGDGFNSHARLLIGIYGPSAQEARSSYEDAIVEFIDPLSGAYRYEPALRFMQDFEAEAAWIVQTKQDEQDLRWQILHY